VGERVYDLAVVGAGPAGAAAALAARRASPGARVVLLDKAVFPRDKPCGDGIAPHAVDELRQLGAAAAVHGYEPVHRLRIRAPNGGPEITASPQRPSYVVPRTVFDARLVEAAVAAGVELRTARVRGVDDRGNVVLVNHDLAARVVVAADGANSTVRRILSVASNPPEHAAIAVRGYAAVPEGPREQLIALVAEGWPAYCWSFPVDRQVANVGYGLVRSGFGGSKQELRDRLGRFLPSCDADPATLRARHLPLSTWRPAPAQGRVLLAGDAASLVNPLSGEGIFYAILSGRLAGTAAVTAPGQADAAYRHALQRQLSRHLRHTAVLARLMRHQPFVAAALGAAGGSPAVRDTMVEVTLGVGTIPAVVLVRIAGAHAHLRLSEWARAGAPDGA
jgi:geranylgeranyl reductase family protein